MLGWSRIFYSRINSALRSKDLRRARFFSPLMENSAARRYTSTSFGRNIPFVPVDRHEGLEPLPPDYDETKIVDEVDFNVAQTKKRGPVSTVDPRKNKVKRDLGDLPATLGPYWRNFMKTDENLGDLLAVYVENRDAVLESKERFAPVLRKLLLSDPASAQREFEEFMKPHPKFTWENEPLLTIAIRVYGVLGLSDKAMQLLKDMKENAVVPRERTFVEIMEQCSKRITNLADLIEVKSLLDDMVHSMAACQTPLYPSSVSFVPAIDSCTAFFKDQHSEEDKAEARKLFQEIAEMSFEETCIPVKSYHTALLNYFKQLPDEWDISNATINDPICSCCNSSLRAIDISTLELNQMKHGVDKIVKDKGIKMKSWASFKTFIASKLGQYDMVIDVANVCYFGQSNKIGPVFQYFQVDSLWQKLKNQGKRCLLVVHGRHVEERQFDRNNISMADREIIQRWKASGDLWSCPPGMNDDWFWLYGCVAIGTDTVVVTNDHCRDHHFEMLSQRLFVRWKERHLVNYDFFVNYGSKTVSNLKLGMPPLYSKRCQVQNEIFHIPFQDKPAVFENDGLRWTCIRKK